MRVLQCNNAGSVAHSLCAPDPEAPADRNTSFILIGLRKGLSCMLAQRRSRRFAVSDFSSEHTAVCSSSEYLRATVLTQSDVLESWRRPHDELQTKGDTKLLCQIDL